MKVSTIQVTADALVRTGPGIVHAVHIAATGLTAADTVQIRDAVAAGAGTVLFTYVATGTNQEHYGFCPEPGMFCSTGIYVDVTKAGGGSVYVTLVYE